MRIGIWAAAMGLSLGALRAEGFEPRQSAVKASNPSGLDPLVLSSLLAQREAELSDLKRRLDTVEDEKLLAEAQRLGVVTAIDRSGLSDNQRRRLAVAVVREAHANGVDPLLVVAVIHIESAFDTYAVSPVGALGLMQVMPATGQSLAVQHGTRLRRPNNLFDIELNVQLGTSYLAELIADFGAVDKALVAYNAGPTAARYILGNKQSRVKFMGGYPHDVLKEFQRLKRESTRMMATRETSSVARPTAD